jgi:hypothetical protein
MPLTSEEKTLRKVQREEKEAEKRAQEKVAMKLEVDEFFQGLPNLVLRLLCELDQEGISYELKQPEPNKFKINVGFSSYRQGFNLAFELIGGVDSFNDYLSVKFDFEEAFQNLNSIRRARFEAEELTRKRQAALSKLTTEERKLLGV